MEEKLKLFKFNNEYLVGIYQELSFPKIMLKNRIFTLSLGGEEKKLESLRRNVLARILETGIKRMDQDELKKLDIYKVDLYLSIGSSRRRSQGISINLKKKLTSGIIKTAGNLRLYLGSMPEFIPKFVRNTEVDITEFLGADISDYIKPGRNDTDIAEILMRNYLIDTGIITGEPRIIVSKYSDLWNEV